MATSSPAAPQARRRLRVVIVVVALVAASGLAAGYGLLSVSPRGANSPGPASTEIDLLPSPGTGSTCITGVPHVPRPELPLRYGTLQANTYNVPNGTSGAVGMCYDAPTGSLFAYANWSRVGPAGGWFSYPQVAYGVDRYAGDATTYTNQSPTWSLPATVASTVDRSLWVTTSYRLDAPGASDVDGYDLSLDDFLSEGLPPTLEVGPFVEVEVFLAHNISYPFAWIHWRTPTLVNGSISDAPWDVGYWCHGVDNSSNASVSFDFSFDGQATAGLADGTVGVNLSAMFAEVEAILPGASCWTGAADRFDSFYLGEEDLGSEDGARGGASYTYNWTVTAYCLRVDGDPTNASSVACHGGTTSPAAFEPGLAPSGSLPPGPAIAPARTTEARPGLNSPPREGRDHSPTGAVGSAVGR